MILLQPHPSSPPKRPLLPLFPQQQRRIRIQIIELPPNPQPPLQDVPQFVAAKSLMKNTSRVLITLYSMPGEKKSSQIFHFQKRIVVV